jgi:hypothetical protein
VAVTDVEQVTKRFATGVTTTVTVEADVTLTTDVTDPATVDALTTVSTIISTL